MQSGLTWDERRRKGSELDQTLVQAVARSHHDTPIPPNPKTSERPLKTEGTMAQCNMPSDLSPSTWTFSGSLSMLVKKSWGAGVCRSFCSILSLILKKILHLGYNSLSDHLPDDAARLKPVKTLTNASCFAFVCFQF